MSKTRISSKKTYHSKVFNIFHIIKYLFKGKSITKILFNMKNKDLNLNGLALDLGSGRMPYPSYYDFLNIDEYSALVTVNIDKNANPHVLADLEKKLPFKDGSFVYILMFNLLEHVYQHKNLCIEAHRVLQKNGILYIFVPFLIKVHEDPCDYFRYTEFALKRLLEDAGFKDREVESLGFGPFTTALYFLSLPYLHKPLSLLFVLTIKIDRLIDCKSKKYYKFNRYPLGYFVKSVKG